MNVYLFEPWKPPPSYAVKFHCNHRAGDRIATSGKDLLCIHSFGQEAQKQTSQGFRSPALWTSDQTRAEKMTRRKMKNVQALAHRLVARE